MNSQISKTIHLMKKSYAQPILFHLLHQNLTYLLTKTTPQVEITDEWSKILILSAHPSNIPNQGLEIKIQKILKTLRPPFDNSEKKLKTMVICYYLLNRPSHLINHIFVFELVYYFLGYSDYIDGLILKIFINMLLAKVYNVQENKMLRSDSIVKMQEIIATKDLAEANKVRSLLCYIIGDTKPISIDSIILSSNYRSYKYIEIIGFYAKYTQNTSFIKDILPSDISFIECLGNFMKNEFFFDCTDNYEIEKCVLIDRSIFEKIKVEFDRCSDKDKFLDELYDFLTTLRRQ